MLTPCVNGEVCGGGKYTYQPPQPPQPAVPVPGDEVVEWLIAEEMLPNAQGHYAMTIQTFNEWAATSLFRCTIGEDGFTACSQAIGYRLVAYRLWKSMVQSGGPWDHKEQITKLFGKGYSVLHNGYLYRFDIWSNVHYGYVGRKVGFTPIELRAGAGYAQIRDRTSKLSYWSSWFDDPYDQAAINVGIELYEVYQLDITPQNFWEIFDKYAPSLPRRWFGEASGGGGSGFE